MRYKLVKFSGLIYLIESQVVMRRREAGEVEGEKGEVEKKEEMEMERRREKTKLSAKIISEEKKINSSENFIGN